MEPLVMFGVGLVVYCVYVAFADAACECRYVRQERPSRITRKMVLPYIVFH